MRFADVHLAEFATLAPAGFYVAVRVGFAFPMVELNRLPAGWVRAYTAGGLVVHDPAMAWVYRNCGFVRWSELERADAQGVLQAARRHGLDFGAAVSWVDEGAPGGNVSERTFGLFCRSDRDYLDDELQRLGVALGACHRAHARPKNLTTAELETLSLVKNGHLMKEIACLLGVSESAIKQRLKNARLKLNAKTGPQAAARATMLGII